MRGQAEFMGIATVAVITVLIILLFRSPLAEEPASGELHEDFLVSMLGTELRCGPAMVQLSDLLRGCVEESCSCRNAAARTLLEAAFTAEGKRYSFVAENAEGIIMEDASGNCPLQTIVTLPATERLTAGVGTC